MVLQRVLRPPLAPTCRNQLLPPRYWFHMRLPMERRKFLELGALAGATATSQACAPSLPGTTSSPSLGDHELRRRLRFIDRIMGSVERASPRWLREHEPQPLSARDQIDARLTQSTIRSLLLTGSIGDLPVEERQHPEVVARLGQAAPEVDYALFGMMARLTMMPADEHDTIQRALRDDPDMVEQIGDCLDQDASDLGVPLRRRLHLRKLLRHVGWRLRRQTLSTVLDEYVGKVRRLAQSSAQSTAPAIAPAPPQVEIDRWSKELDMLVSFYAPTAPQPTKGATTAAPDLDGLAPKDTDPPATVGDPIDSEQAGAEADANTGEQGVAEPKNLNPSGTPPNRPQSPAVDTEQAPHRPQQSTYWTERAVDAKDLMKAGGITMGVGAGVAALSGGLLVVIPITSLVGLTVAAILLIAGLIVLSVGAARLGEAKKHL